MDQANPRIFISYSHDTPAHKESVLRLSERLRVDGIETSLDQYVKGTPPEKWSRWMLNQIDWANFVLLVCSEIYYRRFRGHEEPGKGNGADWEGAVITQAIYDARSSTTKFVPMLFDAADEQFIPEPVRGHTFYVVNSDQAYQRLYDFLLGQAGVEPSPVGEPKRKPRERAKPLAFSGETGGLGDTSGVKSSSQAPKVDLTQLPAGAADFLGREAELKMLDEAWADAGRTQIVELVAAGGVGKTSLVKRWLDRLKADGWRGAQRVYGWSFFSQGTGDDKQASDDSFLNDALNWFGVEHDPALSPWDKGKRLAEAVAASRTLLVLDGVEPLQYPPGPMAGALRTPGLQALLGHLASAGQPGLCILTSRERIRDLEEYERSDNHPAGAVVRCDLGNLSDTDGARLLYKLGVRRAGAAAIGPDDAELRQASHVFHGHALTLSLLGGYLTLAHEGDIRQRDEVALDDDDEAQGGRAFKVMAAYETWFQREGEQGARELAALRLLGFFDRPASAECLTALRATPPIPGLTEPLVGLNTAQWNITLKRLEQCGLIEKAEPDSPAIDAHPLVREYLAKALRERQPEAWREGHRRLYEHLKGSVPYQPEGLAGLEPLYQAVAHGCLAGLLLEAFEEVYFDRILRGTEYEGYYSYRKLGAFGANLGAVACFFEEPWQRVSPDLSKDYQAWLFNEAALQLRALGRLSESREGMQVALEMLIHFEGPVNAANAAIVASNLSEVTLALGRVADAVRSGERAVDLSERSPDEAQRVANRTTLADALHQRGEREQALQLFREAEALQGRNQPEYPLLYSIPGARYCDLLLAEAERAAWRVLLRLPLEEGCTERFLAACNIGERRARQTLRWEERFPGAPLLDFALDHLTLARAALYQSTLGDSALDRAGQELGAAVDDLRAAGQQQEMPRGLLTRVWLCFLQGNTAGARADLDEAWQIASRGGMRLHMADIHLHRARLFRDREALKKARELIEQCGYWRRSEELEDAELAAQNWPVGRE